MVFNGSKLELARPVGVPSRTSSSFLLENPLTSGNYLELRAIPIPTKFCENLGEKESMLAKM